MHTQVILVSIYFAISLAMLPEGFEEPEVVAMTTNNEANNFHGVRAAAHDLLTEMELNSLLWAAYFNLIVMKDVFASYPKRNGFIRKTYDAALLTLYNTTSTLQIKKLHLKYNAVIEPLVKSIEHEAQCIDERFSETGEYSFNEAKEILEACLDFPWEIYVGEVKSIQLALNDILNQYEHSDVNNSPHIIVITTIFLVEDLKNRFEKLQDINMRKWVTKYNFVSVLLAKNNLVEKFDLVEARIKQYEEDQFQSDVWDSTHTSIVEPSVLITSLLQKVAAELHALMQPRYLTQAAVNLRVCAQKMYFHRLLRKAKEMRISLSPEAGVSVHKIRFILGIFNEV